MSHPKTPPDISRLIDQTVERSFTIERGKVNTADRTIELSFSSETPVEQYNWEFGRYLEILDHSPGACDLTRLNTSGPFLVCHDRYDLAGNVESARIDPDKIGRAIIQFSQSDRGKEIQTDINDGVRKGISVRYIVRAMELVARDKEGLDTYRVTKWEPVEISSEPISADISVGPGRTLDDSERARFVAAATKLGLTVVPAAPEPEPVRTSAPPQIPPTPERKETPTMATENQEQEQITAEQIRRAAEKTRRDEIVAIGDLAGQRDLAVDLALDPAVTVEAARTQILAKRKETATATPPPVKPEDLARDQAVTFPYASKPRNFKGKTTEEAARKAYRFAQFILGGPMGNTRAGQYCRDHGILLERAQSESVNEKGGFTVPPEFGNDLIDLREEFGVARRLFKVVPMTSDSRTDPRRTGGLTAYFVDEAGAGTISEKNWDRVSLNAKKAIVLARYSSEINEDSLVTMGDDLGGESAYAFAVKEDDCGFSGDGTSTYSGIVGVRAKLKNLSGTIANIAGLVVATGTGYATSFDSIVLKDLHKVKGRLPQYALRRGPVWVMHQTVWSEVVEALLIAAGGTTPAHIAAGAPPALLGYPVEIAQAMPSTPAVSQVSVLFGYFPLAASFGNRRETTIAISEHSRFANDELEIKATERFDINVHDVGNASATASLRVPGPVVGLITAAS
jgi:HK97 family phage major capsid protein